MEPKVSMADEPTDLDQVVAGQSDLPIRCHWKCLHTRTPHNQGEKRMNENTKFGSIVSIKPIQEGLSFEEWKEYGRNLGRMENMYMWQVGEWWAYGEINYGEKTSITKSDDWDGPSYQTCADAGWVFKKFHFSRRHENLSWSHHREVAGLDEEDADRFLNDAITYKWSRQELRKQVSDFNGKNIQPIIFNLDDPPQTEPPPTKPPSESAPSPSSEPSSSRASNFRSESSTTSVPHPSEPSHRSAPSTESEPKVNPPKPIVSPEAMNISL